MSRYTTLPTKITSVQTTDSMYELISKRKVEQITHYTTKQFNKLTAQDYLELSFTTHIWHSSDKYWKLSSAYYGDPQYWYIIAWFNNRPIESMNNIGDQILIPQPLDRVLEMF
jgi:nucleoid-associated protein YgaU